MPSWLILKRYNPFVIFAALACALGMGLLPLSSRAQSAPTSDQQRQTLIQVLQKRLPGSTPNDWVLGASNPAAAVQPVSPIAGASVHHLRDIWGEIPQMKRPVAILTPDTCTA